MYCDPLVDVYAFKGFAQEPEGQNASNEYPLVFVLRDWALGAFADYYREVHLTSLTSRLSSSVQSIKHRFRVRCTGGTDTTSFYRQEAG
jgi:hypothetical protein